MNNSCLVSVLFQNFASTGTIKISFEVFMMLFIMCILITVVFTINKNITYQTMLGFGGAFTDAAGINIASLSPTAQDMLLASYYSPGGLC